MPLKNWCPIHARWSKTVWNIPYFPVAFFPSLKQNFIAYRSSKVYSPPDCLSEIHQQWQSGFSTVYSNSGCSCSFEHEFIKIGQSSHKLYSNNVLNLEESMTILNVGTKKSGNLLNAPRILNAPSCWNLLVVLFPLSIWLLLYVPCVRLVSLLLNLAKFLIASLKHYKRILEICLQLILSNLEVLSSVIWGGWKTKDLVVYVKVNWHPLTNGLGQFSP